MSKQVLSATALALLLGVSALSVSIAAAQTGDTRADRVTKKSMDDKHLTPIRPIRRVGEDGWPSAKDQPTTRETTGQSSKEKEDTAQNNAKPDTKKNSTLGNQSPPPDKPQDTAKQSAPAKQDTAKQDTKRDNAKSDTKEAQQPASQADKKQDAAQNKDDQKTGEQKNAQTGGQNSEQKAADQKAGQKDDKNFASIRLGTDAGGRVAVNDSQEKQLSSVLHKHRAETFDMKVSVGSVAPANVRVTAVSSDFIDIFPQFRGYSYFATREDIVIVEPSNKKVVALIPIKTTATASRPSEERTTARSTDTRPAGRSKTVVKERDVTVGTAYPTEEEIIAAPVARAPPGTAVTRSYRTYRYEPYYDDGDDVVVIERRRHRPRFFLFW